ncbi:MAG TPA: prolipoprotein diacylglyceryl transferase [Syntrophomonadaceae bacterium]|nr:prolipoprotein diacylglyceryl transferase [Syntrophomonadaceae bacterium]
MRPVLFSIGKYSVYSWGFMLAIAVIVAIWGSGRLFEKQGYKQEWAMDLIIIMVLCGLAGSYLLYFFTYDWSLFWNSPAEYWALHRGGIRGLVWYGGFVGSLVPMLIYLRWRKMSFWNVADIFAPFTALGYALVRIGCFLAGCCYGIITDSPLGVVFPDVDAFSRYPTQLFSSTINFLIFIFLIWIYKRRRFSGQVAILYLLLYPIYRFIIEFYREPEAMIGPLSQAQVISVIMLVIGIGLYIWRARRCANESLEHPGEKL